MSTAWALAGLAEIAPWLVRFTVAGAIVTAVAHVLAFTALRNIAVTRVAAWRTTSVALVLIPALALVLPGAWRLPGGVVLVDVGQAAAELELSSAGGTGLTTPVHEDLVPSLETVFPLLDVLAPSRDGLTADPDVREQGTFGRIGGFPLRWLPLLWIAVTGWLILQLTAGVLALQLHARRAVDVTHEVLHLLPLAVLARGHLRVLRGGPFRVPVCWGVLRPTILLPRGSGGWTSERTRLVLLHECAHVERRDGLFLIVTRIACALHWLNPLVWSLMRRLSAEAEAACDAAVLRAGVPARHYARVLVDVAAEARRTRRPQVALAFALLRTGSLTWRVTRILDPRVMAPARRGVTAAAMLLLALVTLGGATVTLEAEPAPSVEDDAPEESGSQESASVGPRDGAARTFYQGLPEREPQDASVRVAALSPATPAGQPEQGLSDVDSGAIQLVGEVDTQVQRGAATVVNRLERPAVIPSPSVPISRPTPPPPSRIMGTLLEHGTDRPIGQAQVWVVSESGERLNGGWTDPRGQFSLPVPGPGSYYLNASALGYRETTAGIVPLEKEGDVATLKFRIAASPLPVDGLVVVTAGLIGSGFYQRMSSGFGYFISPEDLEASEAVQVTDVLETVPRVDVLRDGLSTEVRMSNAMGYCAPHFYMDEMLVSSDGRDLDSVVPLDAVEAMEVYPTATQVPIQWASVRELCGAIVVWTKK